MSLKHHLTEVNNIHINTGIGIKTLTKYNQNKLMPLWYIQTL